MKNLFRTVKLELKKDLTFFLIMVVLILSLGNIIVNQICIERGIKINQGIAKFIETEQKRNFEYENFFQLRRSGLSIAEMPQPLFYLFFNSAPFRNMETLIDGIIRLNITIQKKGTNVYDQPLGKSNLDFSWFFLFFFSAAALVFGIYKSRNIEYLKFLASITNVGTVFAASLVSAIIMILGFLILTFVVIVIQLSIFNGLSLNANEIYNLLAFLFLPGFLTFLFFFILGFLFGMFKKIVKVVVLSISAWFLFVAFIPEIFNAALSRSTDKLFDSIYAHELKKLEIFSRAEKKIAAEVAKCTTPEEIKSTYKQEIQQYLETDFKEITALEDKMLHNTQRAAAKVQLWSNITLPTLYKSVGNEISGCAYNGYIEFYKTNINNYREFVRYCLENTTERIRPKDKPFIKNPADYVVHLKSSLPRYFLAGVIFNIIVIVILLIFSFYRFKTVLLPAEKKQVCSELELKLKKRKHFVYLLKRIKKNFAEPVYNVLMGKVDTFSGKISIDDKSIVTAEKKNFIYLPNPRSFPGNMKVVRLINMFSAFLKIPKPGKNEIKKEFTGILESRFEDIEEIEKINLLLRLVSYKKADIYMLHDFIINIQEEEIADEIKTKLNKDAQLVIEIDSISVRYRKYDRLSNITLERDADGDKYIEDRVTGMS